jgi:hypothetical protein
MGVSRVFKLRLKDDACSVSIWKRKVIVATENAKDAGNAVQTWPGFSL